MVEIVRLLGWSYVSIIYEESNYGIKVSELLIREFESCSFLPFTFHFPSFFSYSSSIHKFTVIWWQRKGKSNFRKDEFGKAKTRKNFFFQAGLTVWMIWGEKGGNRISAWMEIFVLRFFFFSSIFKAFIVLCIGNVTFCLFLSLFFLFVSSIKYTCNTNICFK